MPLRESDARQLERFLKATTPPAIMSVDFRQRVVQSSLDIRLEQLSRKHTRRSAIFGLITTCAMLVPLGMLTAALAAAAQAGLAPAPFRTAQISDAGLPPGSISVDASELVQITLLQRRVDTWLAAQRRTESQP